MLKALTLKNFVHFKDTYTFKFQNEGPYFFIGANRSGKSCAFEAVRRCMSTSKNLFFSSSRNKEDYSVAVCEYVLEDGRTVFSCYAKEPKTQGVVKLVVEKSRDIFVDILKENKDGYPVNKSLTLGDDGISKLRAQFDSASFSIETLVDNVDKYIVRNTAFQGFITDHEDLEYNAKTDCEVYLKTYIDTQAVITEPMRSISPVQWTNSKKFDNIGPKRTKDSVNFHTEMLDRSEILTWYLETEDVPRNERETVDKYFDILTDCSKIQFKKRHNLIQVIDNGNVVSLEKAPEGFLEAYIFAILLAVKQFKTVCLEEPGRGMHTQMIERMRDIILNRIKDRTVILISHIPAFLTSKYVDNIYFFRLVDDSGHGSKFTVCSGGELLSPDDPKARRIITNNLLVTIFFARRVLLFEGESEQLFMSALKAVLLDDDGLAGRVVQKVNSRVNILQFRRFLISLHLLSLHGEQNKKRVEDICKILGLERLFVLDNDAILGDDGNGAESTDKFFKSFELNDLKENFERTGVPALEKSGIFVWKNAPKREQHPNRKDGTIEDALICLTELDTEGKLKTVFEDNNVTLQWNRTSKVKNRHKLFSSQHLTNQNIDKVVEEVIEYSLKHSDSDVFRLLEFLVNASVPK